MITVLIVGLVVLAAAGGAGAAVLKQRKQRGGPDAPSFTVGGAPTVPAPPPMTGLESALDRVADRSGKTLRDKLEAEAAVVDDLRVPDDTGPLLRRALDRVEQPNEPNEQTQPPGTSPG